MSETAETEIDADDIYSQLTGTQKSAILMMLLGEEEASEILKILGQKKFSILEVLCILFKGLIKIP